MKGRYARCATWLLALGAAAPAASQDPAPGTNPIITTVFTADPAPLVHDGRVYLYVGHDEARGKEMFTLRDWLVFSSADMKHWTAHGPIMQATDFACATKDAWAAEAIEKGSGFLTVVGQGLPADVRLMKSESDDALFQWQDMLRGEFMLLSLKTNRYLGVDPGTDEPYSADWPGAAPDRRNGTVLVWESAP